MKTLEEKQQAKADADTLNETRFKQCVYNADDEFDNGLKLNGKKNLNGSYPIVPSLLQQLERQKENRREECKLLYEAGKYLTDRLYGRPPKRCK